MINRYSICTSRQFFDFRITEKSIIFKLYMEILFINKCCLVISLTVDKSRTFINTLHAIHSNWICLDLVKSSYVYLRTQRDISLTTAQKGGVIVFHVM